MAANRQRPGYSFVELLVYSGERFTWVLLSLLLLSEITMTTVSFVLKAFTLRT